MATTPQTTAKKPAAKAKPKTVSAQVHLAAIEQRVNETTNSIMSRVIGKRDAMAADIDTLHGKVKGTLRAVDAVAVEVADLQKRAGNAVNMIDSVPRQLEARIAYLEERLAVIYASDAENVAGLVGNLVCIKGGTRIMVASGFNEDDLMYCVYEESGKVVTVAVPPMALELAPAKTE